MKGTTTFLIVFFLVNLLSAQQKKKEELIKLINESKSDSLTCSALVELIELETDNTIWPKYNQLLKENAGKYIKAKDAKTKVFYLRLYSDALVNDGFLCHENGDFKGALENYRAGLDIKLDINDRKGAANALSNIGFIFQIIADYDNAIKYYNKGLKLDEESNDKEGAATILVNLANIYITRHDTSKYLELVNKALAYRKEANNLVGIARCYNSLVAMESQKADKTLAFKYCKAALDIYEELNDKEGCGHTLNNLAALYGLSGNLDTSLILYNKALKLNLDVQDNNNISTSYRNIGEIYLNRKSNEKAKTYFELALKYAGYGSGLREQIRAAKDLYVCNKQLNKSGDALRMLELYHELLDSIERGSSKVLMDLSDIFEAPKVDSLATDSKGDIASVVENDQVLAIGVLAWLQLVSGFVLLILIPCWVFANTRI